MSIFDGMTSGNRYGYMNTGQQSVPGFAQPGSGISDPYSWAYNFVNQNPNSQGALGLMGSLLGRQNNQDEIAFRTTDNAANRQSEMDRLQAQLQARRDEYTAQIEAAARQGDLNRAQELTVQQRNLDAQMAQLQLRGQQATDLNRETMYGASQLSRQNAVQDIYGKAAGMATNAQTMAARNDLQEGGNLYRRLLAQGGVFSPQEVNQMKTAAFNDVNDAAKSAGANLNNALAAKGLGGNPYAAASMGLQGRFAAGANRAKVGADITQQQASSRLGAMGQLTDIGSRLAGYSAMPTQENAIGMAQAMPQVKKPWWSSGSNPYSTT